MEKLTKHMQLSDNDLFLLSRDAISAASQAGKIIAEYAKHPASVQSKTGGESYASQVVTEVDFLCQELILKTLLPSCEKFDLALLTEESTDDRMRLEKEYFWCIDPLDGTLPFIEKTSGYAVAIALVSQSGTPVIGVIYDPVKQVLYHAVKGAGAFRNEKKWDFIHPSHIDRQFLTIISDRSFIQQSYYSKAIEALHAIAIELGLDGLKHIEHGGAAMNACWVLENYPACYFKFPKQKNSGGSLWDYAATSCLFNETGAFVSDIYGKPLDLNRPDSTFMNHRGILYASHQNIAEIIQKLYKKIKSSSL